MPDSPPRPTPTHFIANPFASLPEPPSLPADWDARIRHRLDKEAGLLLSKVQHGKLRGGGTDVYTGYSWVCIAVGSPEREGS